MSASLLSRAGVFAALVALMALTRFNHFGAMPDASWAVFFAAGYYLRSQWRWAFPALMAVAVLIDFAVITRGGGDFFAHYCVSPGYWFLLPAHFAMWMGGSWLSTQSARPLTLRVMQLAGVAVLSVVLCHAFAQGGFYWLSSSVAEPSVAGWLKNYSDWLLPYMRTTGSYIAVIAAIHALAVVSFGRSAPSADVKAH